MENDKPVRPLTTVLAELVVWYGNESNGEYLKRLKSAEALLKRVDPAELKRLKQIVKESE